MGTLQQQSRIGDARDRCIECQRYPSFTIEDKLINFIKSINKETIHKLNNPLISK